ncbi:MAG: tryptophan synthase subunit beta, partial [Acidobacteria bacterium]|nr:tryptophan synthase subunit beta [Acidobacteriota bacterium]
MGKQSKSPTSDSSHFGPYGGVFVPETLMSPLEELEEAYGEARSDEEFQRELEELLHLFAGRPT